MSLWKAKLSFNLLICLVSVLDPRQVSEMNSIFCKIKDQCIIITVQFLTAKTIYFFLV